MAKRPRISSLDGVHDETILDVADVAAILNCSTQTASRKFWKDAEAGQLLSTGKIRGGFRLGSRLKISAGDLRKAIEAMKIRDDEVADALEAQSRRRGRA